MTPPSPTDNPRERVLLMDGMEHTVPGRDRCRCEDGNHCGQYGERICPDCGGFLHLEYIYYGYYYMCETCEETFP